MRIFGSDRISGLMQQLGMEEGVPIEHGMVTRAIERAQKQVEAQNFSVRKHLLEYDDVMNKQRENIYALRRQILEGKIQFEDEDGQEEVVGTRDYLMSLAEEILDSLVETYAAREADYEQWDLDALQAARSAACSRSTPATLDFTDRTSDEIRDALWERIQQSYDEKEQLVGREVLRARRARHHAADRRQPVEGPPLQPRSPEGRHRAARLRPARSARSSTRRRASSSSRR